ncbi:M42 family peptidase, partial [Halolamina salina]
MHDRELLFDLARAAGPVGYEDSVRAVVREALAPAVDRIDTDAMGNVVGTVEGEGDREVVVAAHMDEIGFMVSRVTDDGFLRLDALGGWNAQILRAQPVTVHTDDGTVAGVIGAEPAHTRDEDDVEDIDDLAVDLGLDGDAAAETVSVGDVVTLDAEPRLLGDCVTG